MLRSLRIPAMVLAAFLTLSPMAPAAARPGRVVVGYYGGWWGPVWWGPSWYGPWWGPPYYPYPLTGNVKILTHTKDDSIYVDGGYIGRTDKMKKFPLRPGNHTIQLRNARGRTFYQERVYVIPGKTIKIRPGYPA